MRALNSIVLLSTLVAGCTGSPSGDPLPGEGVSLGGWAARALAHDDAHNHADPLDHQNLSTPNFRVLGWDPLITATYGTSVAGMFCGDVSSEGERLLAVMHEMDYGLGFVLADVTDPTRPVKAGELDLPDVATYDVTITPDGRFVVVSSFQTSVDAASRGGMYGGSVLLVDIQDPSNPIEVDVQPSPLFGPHSLSTARTDDGTVWILASVHNGYHAATYFQFFRLVETPLGARLVPAGAIQAQSPDPDAGWSLTTGHVDGEIQTHPITGEHLAYLAANNGGLIVARLEDAAITRIGSWNDYDQAPLESSVAPMTGRIHSTYPLPELWDGRHYTIIGQENGGRPPGRPTGQVIVMDTTDPTDPRPVARWTLPHDPGPWGLPEKAHEQLLFSTHYFTVVNHTLFVSMYHGGLWAVDMAKEHWPELPSIGVFLPDRQSPAPGEKSPSRIPVYSPHVMDVLRTPEGRLVTWDASHGVYVLEFDMSVPVRATSPWVNDAWLPNPPEVPAESAARTGNPNLARYR